MDPEKVHDKMIMVGSFLGHLWTMRFLTKILFGYSNESLNQNILGIDFQNPVGLAAGFDKNADLPDIIGDVGFGSIEVGSITALPCEGNPGKHLWRLPKSSALVVYYGLKNKGAKIISKKLLKFDKRNPSLEVRLSKKAFGNLVLGTSVAMTNCAKNADIYSAIEDFSEGFRAFSEIGDYMTVNISCPNTSGGMPFIEASNLDSLLTYLDTIPTSKPVFLKFSPDTERFDVKTLVEIAHKHRVHGIICSNLTKNRINEEILDKDVPNVGGISGKPVKNLTKDLISQIYQMESILPVEKRLIVVGCGGIFSAEDAYEKIKHGASLVQLITGMIYEGPQLISAINIGLTELLKKDGYKNISEAIGVYHRG